MRSSTRNIILILLLTTGLALGCLVGIIGGFERPYRSTADWQTMVAPPGGAEVILAAYASQYSVGNWQLYVRAADERIYLNDSGAGWQEAAEVVPPSGAEDCGATMFTPPILPDVAVESRYVSICHAELIEQYGFARLTDGSLLFWKDSYTGLYGWGVALKRSLGSGAIGCLCGGLLAGVLLGLLALLSKRATRRASA